MQNNENINRTLNKNDIYVILTYYVFKKRLFVNLYAGKLWDCGKTIKRRTTFRRHIREENVYSWKQNFKSLHEFNGESLLEDFLRNVKRNMFLFTLTAVTSSALIEQSLYVE